jgi:hypothetical protein
MELINNSCPLSGAQQAIGQEMCAGYHDPQLRYPRDLTVTHSWPSGLNGWTEKQADPTKAIAIGNAMNSNRRLIKRRAIQEAIEVGAPIIETNNCSFGTLISKDSTNRMERDKDETPIAK